MRVCFVCNDDDLEGPRGRLRAEIVARARALAEAGHRVTLLGAFRHNISKPHASEWEGRREVPAARYVRLPDPDFAVEAPPHGSVAYGAYLWLRDQAFDVVHFPDRLGTGYYCVLAKRQGLAFERTALCVLLRGATLAHRAARHEHLDRLDDLEIDFMERQVVRLADVAVGPSPCPLRKVSEAGWQLPVRCWVHPPLLPESDSEGGERGEGTDASVADTIAELVCFLPRVLTREVFVFLGALDHLAQLSPALTVTFVPGPDGLDEAMSGLLAARGGRWPFRWQILADADPIAVLEGPGRTDRLAILPKGVELAPSLVLHCLAASVAFLVDEGDGLLDLVATEDREAVRLSSRSSQALARRLEEVVTKGARPARPTITSEQSRRAWVEWHSDFAPTSEPAPSPPVELLEAGPLVSVCLVHHNRPAPLRQALDSLERQDEPRFEVVLVDDGSTLPEATRLLDALEPAFARRGWRIVRQENRYLGAARNTAARHARGEYLLFMDDDNVAKPHEISTFLRVAARTDADVLTSAMDIFVGPDSPGDSSQPRSRWVPLGGCPLAGVFRNNFGDANALVRRDVFRAVGGFTEDAGVTHEDWEFFARALLRGFRLEVIPEALFWYRRSPDSMLRTTSPWENTMRSLRPYLEAVPEPLRAIFPFCQGLQFRLDGLFVEYERLYRRFEQKADQAHRQEDEIQRQLEQIGQLQVILELHRQTIRYRIADALNARLMKLGLVYRLAKRVILYRRRLRNRVLTAPASGNGGAQRADGPGTGRSPHARGMDHPNEQETETRSGR